MRIHVEFGGGLELLFRGQKSLELEIGQQKTLGDLMVQLKNDHLDGDPDLFMMDSTIRPGVLVLVNDTDWELVDRTDYIMEEADRIVFLSTLHGG